MAFMSHYDALYFILFFIIEGLGESSEPTISKLWVQTVILIVPNLSHLSSSSSFVHMSSIYLYMTLVTDLSTIHATELTPLFWYKLCFLSWLIWLFLVWMN